ncbi:MAG: class I SAM-dependent methyltransferase [Candidatus Odinarchaeota archaeon]
MVWQLFLSWVLIGFLLILFFVCIVLRVIRHYYKFPIPSFLTEAIDNPIRRRFLQKPMVLADRIGLKPGMIVVEIGPGKGSYTKVIAERVLPDGKVYAIDIQEAVIARLKKRVTEEGIPNIIPQIDNAHRLSFADMSVDRVFALACLPEIPEPVKVLREVYRILKPDGLVSLAEFAPDPDYPLRRTVKRWATDAGLELHSEYGNWFSYQLNFKKGPSET